MREVARSRNLLSGFVTTLKRLFESVVGILFCLLLYVRRCSWVKLKSSGSMILPVFLTVVTTAEELFIVLVAAVQFG